MKNYLLILLFAGLLVSCGNNDEKKTKPEVTIGAQSTTKKAKETPKAVVSTGVDLVNKGVGAIKSVTLGEIDNALVERGEELFNMNCTACHKVNRKFIGPAMEGILERRTPEWTMNMILDPERMVREDPLAKQLLIEHNGSPMANQGLSEDEVRAILEYFRTL